MRHPAPQEDSTHRLFTAISQFQQAVSTSVQTGEASFAALAWQSVTETMEELLSAPASYGSPAGTSTPPF
jgi:hypothetical protein